MECYHADQKHVIPREELIRVCSSSRNLRDRALVSILALTGARVNEVSSLIRDDVKIDYDKGMIKVKLLCSKRREAGKIYRVNPIPINPKFSKGLIEPFLTYINLITFPGKLLFPTERRCRQITQKLVGHSPHCFRHTMATFLTESYGFDSTRLREWFGTKSSNWADTYAHLSTKYMERLLLES